MFLPSHNQLHTSHCLPPQSTSMAGTTAWEQNALWSVRSFQVLAHGWHVTTQKYRLWPSLLAQALGLVQGWGWLELWAVGLALRAERERGWCGAVGISGSVTWTQMFGAWDHRLHRADMQSPGSTKHVKEWIGSEVCQELGWLWQAGGCSAPHCTLQQQHSFERAWHLVFPVIADCIICPCRYYSCQHTHHQPQLLADLSKKACPCMTVLSLYPFQEIVPITTETKKFNGASH